VFDGVEGYGEGQVWEGETGPSIGEEGEANRDGERVRGKVGDVEGFGARGEEAEETFPGRQGVRWREGVSGAGSRTGPGRGRLEEPFGGELGRSEHDVRMATSPAKRPREWVLERWGESWFRRVEAIGGERDAVRSFLATGWISRVDGFAQQVQTLFGRRRCLSSGQTDKLCDPVILGVIFWAVVLV
jgi:hypothetical protein